MDHPPIDKEGYEIGEVLSVPTSKTEWITTRYGKEILLAFVLLLSAGEWVAPIGFIDILRWAHGIDGLPLWDIVAVIFSMVIAGPLTMYLHEGLHQKITEHFGYPTKVEYGAFTAATMTLDTPIQKKHLLISLCAPLLLISPLSYIIALAVPVWELKILFSIVFLANTFGSAADVVDFTRSMKEPPGVYYRLIQTDDGFESIHYYPTDSNRDLG